MVPKRRFRWKRCDTPHALRRTSVLSKPNSAINAPQLQCTCATCYIRRVTFIPRGWKPEFVKSLLTVPGVSFPVRWCCFWTTSTGVPGGTLLLTGKKKKKAPGWGVAIKIQKYRFVELGGTEVEHAKPMIRNKQTCCGVECQSQYPEPQARVSRPCRC